MITQGLPSSSLTASDIKEASRRGSGTDIMTKSDLVRDKSKAIIAVARYWLGRWLRLGGGFPVPSDGVPKPGFLMGTPECFLLCPSLGGAKARAMSRGDCVHVARSHSHGVKVSRNKYRFSLVKCILLYACPISLNLSPFLQMGIVCIPDLRL